MWIMKPEEMSVSQMSFEDKYTSIGSGLFVENLYYLCPTR